MMISMNPQTVMRNSSTYRLIMVGSPKRSSSSLSLTDTLVRHGAIVKAKIVTDAQRL